jgi:hypothetical protein
MVRVVDAETGDEWNFEIDAWTIGAAMKREGFGPYLNPYQPHSDKWRTWVAAFESTSREPTP